MNQKMDFSFSSELLEVKSAVSKVLSFVDAGAPCISPDDRMDLRLVFSELLNNAVIHGNKSDRRKRVFLTAEFRDETLYSTITDEGVGFNYEVAGRPPDITDENGRGIVLASCLTDSMSFNERGNRIYFHKKVRRAQ